MSNYRQAETKRFFACCDFPARLGTHISSSTQLELVTPKSAQIPNKIPCCFCTVILSAFKRSWKAFTRQVTTQIGHILQIVDHCQSQSTTIRNTLRNESNHSVCQKKPSVCHTCGNLEEYLASNEGDSKSLQSARLSWPYSLNSPSASPIFFRVNPPRLP